MGEEVRQVAEDEGAEGLFCPECGYDLRHSEGRCSECGRAFDRGELRVSRIPWVHRKEIGRFRAWRRTMWLAIWSPGKLAQEVARPVSWGDASRFRWVMVWVTSLLATGVCAVGYWDLYLFEFRVGVALDPSIFVEHGVPPWVYPPWALMTGPGMIFDIGLGVLAGIAASTWWVRMWFWVLSGKGPQMRERASALSCYGSAWWLVVAMMVGLDLAIVVAGGHGAFDWVNFRGVWHYWAPLLFIGGVEVVHFVVLVMWWLGMLKLLRASTRCQMLGTGVAAVGMPVGGALVFVVAAWVVSYVLGLAALAVAGFWR